MVDVDGDWGELTMMVDVGGDWGELAIMVEGVTTPVNENNKHCCWWVAF